MPTACDVEEEPVGLPSRDPRPKAVVSWSSGKDSAYALHRVRSAGGLAVVGLLTTVTSTFDRVSMHGVRRTLLDAQARAVGLPMEVVEIPEHCPNEVYEAAMGRTVARLRESGVERMVFGDLFLREIREYRESRLKGTGIRPVFPLWGEPTDRLARRMIEDGAHLVCIDTRKVPAAWAGRRFDEPLLRELPASVDPCGENGEFHTFVSDGPGFRRAIGVRLGRREERPPFRFADLTLARPRAARRAPSRRPATRASRSRGTRRSP
jgi:uncharacterized protein (TIGR00290 family)